VLKERFCSLLDQGWKTVFAQKRSRERANGHALALPCIMGQRTISRTIWIFRSYRATDSV
jgi:hypothetical protein